VQEGDGEEEESGEGELGRRRRSAGRRRPQLEEVRAEGDSWSQAPKVGWLFAQPIQLLLLLSYTFLLRTQPARVSSPVEPKSFASAFVGLKFCSCLFSTQVQVAASALFQFPNACPALVIKDPCSVLNCAEILQSLLPVHAPQLTGVRGDQAGAAHRRGPGDLRRLLPRHAHLPRPQDGATR
jgi:hypothetical protein